LPSFPPDTFKYLYINKYLLYSPPCLDKDIFSGIHRFPEGANICSKYAVKDFWHYEIQVNNSTH
jgi:hypothetical protein